MSKSVPFFIKDFDILQFDIQGCLDPTVVYNKELTVFCIVSTVFINSFGILRKFYMFILSF